MTSPKVKRTRRFHATVLAGVLFVGLAFAAQGPAGPSPLGAPPGQRSTFDPNEGSASQDRSLDSNGTGLPDLVIDHLEVLPWTPPGSAFQVLVAYRNAGNAPAGNFTIGFEVDHHLVGLVRVGGLAPGQPGVASNNTGHLEPGNHSALVRLDHLHEVHESNEANNTATRAFHAFAVPA